VLCQAANGCAVSAGGAVAVAGMVAEGGRPAAVVNNGMLQQQQEQGQPQQGQHCGARSPSVPSSPPPGSPATATADAATALAAVGTNGGGILLQQQVWWCAVLSLFLCHGTLLYRVVMLLGGEQQPPPPPRAMQAQTQPNKQEEQLQQPLGQPAMARSYCVASAAPAGASSATGAGCMATARSTNGSMLEQVWCASTPSFFLLARCVYDVVVLSCLCPCCCADVVLMLCGVVSGGERLCRISRRCCGCGWHGG
jgi:hypothetical protein